MRYVITGGSGYIGSRLVEHLSKREGTERLDVCDREAARSILERVKPDALVHLAFILNPVHDEFLMYDVDVNGTHNVLEAAGVAGTEHVLVASSAVAYGA